MSWIRRYCLENKISQLWKKGKHEYRTATYIFEYTEEKDEIINYIANHTGLSRFDFSLSEMNGVSMRFPIWLRLFLLNPRFVVTDSFHGCVFSIIFRKDFIAILNEGRGAVRFYSLLNMFDLEDRLVTGLDDLKKQGRYIENSYRLHTSV